MRDEDAKKAKKFFHLNAKNDELVCACEASGMEEALAQARRWNRGEKRPEMVVELVCSHRSPAMSFAVAAVC